MDKFVWSWPGRFFPVGCLLWCQNVQCWGKSEWYSGTTNLWGPVKETDYFRCMLSGGWPCTHVIQWQGERKGHEVGTLTQWCFSICKHLCKQSYHSTLSYCHMTISQIYFWVISVHICFCFLGFGWFFSKTQVKQLYNFLAIFHSSTKFDAS